MFCEQLFSHLVLLYHLPYITVIPSTSKPNVHTNMSPPDVPTYDLSICAHARIPLHQTIFLVHILIWSQTIHWTSREETSTMRPQPTIPRTKSSFTCKPMFCFGTFAEPSNLTNSKCDTRSWTDHQIHETPNCFTIRRAKSTFIIFLYPLYSFLTWLGSLNRVATGLMNIWIYMSVRMYVCVYAWRRGQVQLFSFSISGDLQAETDLSLFK